VYNGAYYENLEVDKSLNLIGEDRDTTYISSLKEYKRTVWVFTNNFTISGFTITGSNWSAIYIGENNYSELYNFSIIDNIISFNYGVGIGIYNSQNVIISNNLIDCNRKYGIRLIDTSEVKITTNKISKNLNGIDIDYFFNGEDVENYIIKDNVITNNKRRGINIDYCKGLLIANNSITCNNDSGVRICLSNYSTISNNNVNNNKQEGIWIFRSFNSTIIWNNISNNNWSGIISLNTNNHSIMHNLIRNNENGIHLVSSNNGSIATNYIINNVERGIRIDNSYGNTITHNNFINNGRQASFFFSIKNNWNGNYWNRPWFLPKPIFGIGIGFIFLGRIRWFPIPWVNFDFRPAQEPYDIEV
jgi:parallel beta-helix repeat protein